MNRLEHIRDLMNTVKYKDWKFRLGEMDEGHFIQVQFLAPDNDNPGQLLPQTGTKWYISPYAIDAEIIRTAFKAVRDAEYHEMCEQFLYKGVRIMNPHIDYEVIVEAAQKYGNHASVDRDGRHSIHEVS